MARLLALNDRFWPVIVILIVSAVTVLSLLPPAATPEVGGGDKLHHLVAYAAIVFPIALARPRPWPLLLALVALWGIAIEIIQPHFGRNASLGDVAANLAGIAIGASAGLILGRRRSGSSAGDPARARAGRP
jgi:VanZ family protein